MDKNKKGGSNFKKFWLPLFLFAVAIIIFYKVVDRLPQVFSAILDVIGVISPFIGGLIIAFVLYKPVFKFEKLLLKSKKTFLKNHARGISVLGSYCSLILILTLILYLLLPRIFSSAMSLVQNLPTYYNSAVEYVKTLSGEDGKIFGFDLNKILNSLSVSNILSYFDLSAIGKYAGEIFSATGTIINVFMAFVVSVYVLLGRNHLIKVARKILSMVLTKEKVQKLGRYSIRISDIFYSYIYSQLIDAVIVFILCFIIFSIIGVPYGLLLAILMGLCNMIPYFGAIIGGGVTVIVTIITSGNFLKAIIVLACIIVVQQVDANLIQPKIVANSVGLKPIYVLLAIMIGSGLFGFVGMLICVPVMAVIRMIIVDYMKHLGGEDTLIVKKQKELAAEKTE